MPFTFQKAQRNVAMFAIFGLFFLAAISIFVLKGNNIFEIKYKYYTFFSEGHNISSGMAIKYKGFMIGKVNKAKLLNDDTVQVELSIYKKYSWLAKEGSVLKISSSLLGSSGLVIVPPMDENAPELEKNSVIFSSEMDQGQAILASITEPQTSKGDDLTVKAQQVIDMILELQPLIRSTLYNVKVITGNIATLTSSLNGEAETAMADRIFAILDKTYDSIERVNQLTKKFSSPDNTIGKILNDNAELYSKVSELLAQVNSLLADLKALPADIQKSLDLVEKNLIQLKYVLENIPLIPKQKDSTTTINSDDRG